MGEEMNLSGQGRGSAAEACSGECGGVSCEGTGFRQGVGKAWLGLWNGKVKTVEVQVVFQRIASLIILCFSRWV